MEITTCRNIISYTATLPRLSFQSAEMLVSCTATLPMFFSAVITTCRNISYTATLPRLSFQSAEMLVSCTATLPRWKLQPAEILSVTQPLFQGCNYNLPKCGQMHSHSSEVFLGCNYNLPKYQLHSHSSEVFLGCNYNLPKCWSVAQPLPINPPPHCWPTGGHLNLPCQLPH